MTAPFFVGIALLFIGPVTDREKSYDWKALSKEKEISLEDDMYDALLIEDIYADAMYVSSSETPDLAEGRIPAEIVKNSGSSRNTFRVDLTSFEKGTYYIHTKACYAMFCYKLVLE
jgi:hypothetical protein